LTFVPNEFDRSTLAEPPGQAGFSRAEPAFFSWLGATMCLGEKAIMRTLRFTASLAPASSVVFDYAVLPSFLSPKARRAMESLSATTSEHDEPWKTSPSASISGMPWLTGFQ